MASNSESWGSRIGIVLAMAGNAVGFGNFLRFPIQAMENGGGVFIIPYIVCFLLLGIPLTFVEWTIGRFGGQFGKHSTPYIMEQTGKRRGWRYVGVLGIFSTLAIASYYCYIESWTLTYVYHSIIGSFQGMSQSETASFFSDYQNTGNSHSGIPYENVIAFILCLALNIWILSRGLKGGIEKVAKFGVPLLIIFGIFLAIRGIMIQPGEYGAIAKGVEGLDFLWTPQVSSLLDPKVWLAAAGQIFFTLSLGMGCIQCYASYMKHDEDIALGALSTSFVNEFVEIVLGGTIIISISVGFFGLEHVLSMISNEGGFGIAFQTMPFLFNKWGAVMGILCGVAFFGLLFIAGITSSLAMCTPAQALLRDEFGWSRTKSAIAIGITILLWGLPTVIFYKQGVFSEYDYWAGTVSLFVFAMLEAILFSWVNGIDNSWKEFNHAADIKIPKIYKYILKYITPTLLIIIFIAALIKPNNDDWSQLSLKGWEVDANSIIGKFQGKDAGPNHKWIADTLYADLNGYFSETIIDGSGKHIRITALNEIGNEYGFAKSYPLKDDDTLLLHEGDPVEIGDPIMTGRFVNDTFYQAFARLYMILLLLIIFVIVFFTSQKRDKLKKVNP
ncbi:sodium-dependent transporter [Bacteroidales bacterium OttesenSCG-928-B11]|nr:sodium-dependent transporter [Bacteroidales bacterium OttesenSCG-928-C03]MDL2311575.1 sodium-dependent transporter [Bacteroidales bacterium OttesenSCG-928-B11]MDL2326791.1 sodium-dependent transporter [Bacteroidales bacterium OttesenSCG-928-A14]